MLVRRTFISCLLFLLADGSSLTQPPQSALVIAFDKFYEQSLLAYTLSDQNIDSTLIVSSDDTERLYEKLLGVEVLKLKTNGRGSTDKAALEACQALLGDEDIAKRVREILPTFVIFPALRHDACLLPWIESIDSIPVIVTYGSEEDLYVVHRTQLALPIHGGSLWSGFWSNVNSRSIVANANSAYVAPALKIVKQHLPTREINFDESYFRVPLVLSTGDPILRSDFASLGQRLVDIGCHHCKGAHPLPAELQKALVEFRLGTIAVTLDDSFAPLVEGLARTLPQGRQGQAVAWKNYNVRLEEEKKPENLFIHDRVDRQDLIGYARTRVLLSHCEEVELLETLFHGTPVVCFPRNEHERINARRALDLGFAVSSNDDKSIEAVAAAVEHVHKTAAYREVARSLSVLIRDRSLPASDRLIFWLGYIARNNEREITLPVLRANTVRTFAGDIKLLTGFLGGTIIGGILAIAAIFAWFKSKSNYKQTRKDKKFSR